ncbi:MAG: hypothetical protein EOO88_00830 [Pedobacter sp.]|nr:MAG: hypothetical protein EOO88_00830 [Pedobacter sp.]
MSNEYQESVVTAYQNLKNESRLSMNLAHPSTANLRDECLRKISQGFTDSDEKVIRSFFGLPDDNNEYSKTIGSVDVDIFRQLVKVLNGQPLKTDQKNIELLAWLIDYQPRPSTEFYANPRTLPDEITGGTIVTGKNSTTLNIKILILIVGMSILLTWSGAFLLWRNGYIIDSINYPENAKCMHWVGNRYELIDCNEKSVRSGIIPLDPVKLSRFRRIMLRDTLTRNSLGKVWCANVGKDAVFFTDSGTNPIDSSKRLRSMTPYMLAKYASYPRYLLQLFLWIISGISFGLLYWLWAFLLLKKKKPQANS